MTTCLWLDYYNTAAEYRNKAMIEDLEIKSNPITQHLHSLGSPFGSA